MNSQNDIQDLYHLQRWAIFFVCLSIHIVNIFLVFLPNLEMKYVCTLFLFKHSPNKLYCAQCVSPLLRVIVYTLTQTHTHTLTRTLLHVFVYLCLPMHDHSYILYYVVEIGLWNSCKS